MTKFALKGLLTRKLRTALTAVAIVLGVAMISGTYILTDSIDSAFDQIFTDVRQGSNVVDLREVRVRPLGRQRRHRAHARRVPPRRGARASRGRAGGRERRQRFDVAHRQGRQGDRLRRGAESRVRDRGRGVAVQPAQARRGQVAGDGRDRHRLRGRGQGGLLDRRRDRRAGGRACPAPEDLRDRRVRFRPLDRRRHARRLRPPDGAAPVREGGAARRDRRRGEARRLRPGSCSRRSGRSFRRTRRRRRGWRRLRRMRRRRTSSSRSSAASCSPSAGSRSSSARS